MAYYARERLQHTLTPEIEANTRSWDKAYHYLNHYFKQTNGFDYQGRCESNGFERKPPTPSGTNNFDQAGRTTKESFKPQTVDSIGFKPNQSNSFYSSTYDNCFRTVKAVQNSYHIPNYTGHIPGMKTQNPFAKTFTKITKEEIQHFDNRRADRNYDIELNKKWNYDPLSKTYGEFFKSGNLFHSSRLQKTIINHPYTLRVRATSTTSGNNDWKTPEIYNKSTIQNSFRSNPVPPKDYYFEKSAKFTRSTSSNQ